MPAPPPAREAPRQVPRDNAPRREAPEPVRPAPPPQEPPAPGGFAPAIRQSAPAPAEAVPAAGSGELWRQLAESCKGQLPPMYRAFLDLCRGTVSGGLVQVYAPDDITKGRLDNDRVLGVLRAQGESLTGGPVQVRLIVGTPPAVSADQRRQQLIDFGRQLDAVEIQD